MTIPSLLFVVFVTLKLVGVIHWPWIFVCAPLWVPLLVVLFVFIFISTLGALASIWR